jgi:hypothetical protein
MLLRQQREIDEKFAWMCPSAVQESSLSADNRREALRGTDSFPLHAEPTGAIFWREEKLASTGFVHRVSLQGEG